MPRARAAAGSLVFLVVAPGVVAGLVPWLLTDWHAQEQWAVLEVVGWILLAAGVAALLHAFALFVIEGLGTPAPVAPTESLVVGGLYRYVRNPMYLAVGAAIVGQALVLGRPAPFLYAAVFAIAVAAFARWYEEPTLRAHFGEQYETYPAAVPAWWPRRKPWKQSSQADGRRGLPWSRQTKCQAPDVAAPDTSGDCPLSWLPMTRPGSGTWF